MQRHASSLIALAILIALPVRMAHADADTEARLRDAAEGINALGRLAREFPQLLSNAEVISTMLAQGGLRLHPDTALQIATAQLARTLHVRVALWIAAGALVVLAIGLL